MNTINQVYVSFHKLSMLIIKGDSVQHDRIEKIVVQLVRCDIC